MGERGSRTACGNQYSNLTESPLEPIASMKRNSTPKPQIRKKPALFLPKRIEFRKFDKKSESF
jgi:hypothetical protein